MVKDVKIVGDCVKCGMNSGKRNFYSRIYHNNLFPSQHSDKRFSQKSSSTVLRIMITVFVTVIGAITYLSVSDRLTPIKFADPNFDYMITDNDGTIYQGKYSSNVGVAITQIQKMSSFDSQFSKQSAIGIYNIMRIEVANKQKDPILLDFNTFKLVDDKNREFLPSCVGDSLLSMRSQRVFVKKINPGISYSGLIAYDVPIDALIVTLSFTGGVLGERKELPFQVVVK